MKKFDWLMLFGWPALITIILLSLLASPMLLSDKGRPSAGPSAPAANVKYTIRNGKKPIISEEMAEIRALYASDLFASSRGNHFPASQAVTNRSDQRDIIPSENPLFLAFPPASNETNGWRFAKTGRKTDNYEMEPGFQFNLSGQSSHRAKKPVRATVAGVPKLAVELKGELKRFSIEPDVFQNIVLPAERKPWSVQAEVRINRAGRIEHVLAEPIDCEPSIYQEIVKKLYQCHFSNVTQACEGIIIISYPACFAANPPDLPVSLKEKTAASK